MKTGVVLWTFLMVREMSLDQDESWPPPMVPWAGVLREGRYVHWARRLGSLTL